MPQRLILFRAAVALFCAIILVRLVQLQVLEGERNRELADQNRIRVVRLFAPRGNIYDRRGRLLAGSRLAFSVNIVPEELQIAGSSDPVADLAALLGLPPEDVRSYLSRQAVAGYEPIPLYRECPAEVVARLEERLVYTSGVNILAEAVRHYPLGPMGAHALGYVREISAEELSQRREAGYRPLDLIGKAGVEKMEERALRGVDGGYQVEVDARGRRVRTLGMVPPQPGNDAWLTLDLDIQRAAQEGLADMRGAAVALDPTTGEVLALASSPSFDPNLFIGQLTSADWSRLSGPGHPQQNRATTSRYPPGSVFKIITAAAALETGKATTGDWFHCDGAYRIGGWALRCWKRSGHGDLDFTQGFAQSCNTMFATLGRRVGPEALAETARQFGLGRRCGIDLPEESSGLVPTPEWKRERRRQPWFPGDTCQMAVGQGDCLVTPLQVARQVAAVANGGTLVQPRVVLQVEGERGPRRSETQGALGLSDATLEALRKAMEAVCSPGGTAARLANEHYRVAGKTGTAEAAGGPPHAWFAGYAPADAPRVAVAVVIERGGQGSEQAVPVARAMLDAALLPQTSPAGDGPGNRPPPGQSAPGRTREEAGR